MQIKKIIAAVAASAMAVSAMAVSAFAAESFSATLGYADGTWTAQDWETTTEITGDGTYSVSADCQLTVVDEDTGEEVTGPVAGSGIMVFVVDIIDLGKAIGIEAPEGATEEEDSWKYETGDVKVSDVKITTGATEIAVDQANVKVGDIEGNGKLRIEFYNEYGPTKSAPAVDPATFAFTAEDQFTVTFTITGVDAFIDGADTGAGDKANSDTGVEGLAVVAGLAIVAAGAVVVAKKRG